MKQCIKCGEEKELSDFPTYKSRKGELMYKNQCKLCNSAYKKSHYEANKQIYLDRARLQRTSNPTKTKEYLRAYYRRNREELIHKAKIYSNTTKGKTVRKVCRDNYRSKPQNKFKDEVRKLTYLAIKYGVIVRPNKCSNCGSEYMIEAHHNDYSKPLDIEWLCKTCHENKHHLNEGDNAIE